MDFLLNELSFHGQFSSVEEFGQSLECLMIIRESIKRYGKDLYVRFEGSDFQVTRDRTLKNVVQSLPRDEKIALMIWLDKSGPFWEYARKHSSDDFFYVDKPQGMEVVTDSAPGEAAYRNLNYTPCGLVSLSPSDWNSTPIAVLWCLDEESEEIQVSNHWEIGSVLDALKACPPAWSTWAGLREFCRNRFRRIHVWDNSFDSISRYPFSVSVGNQIISRLEVLEKIADSFDDKGRLNREGNELVSQYFHGNNAWFSDSSDSEKQDYKKEMTFKDPKNKASVTYFWHGKLQSKNDPIRIHFSWPIKSGDTLSVAYIGPKLTKK